MYFCAIEVSGCSVVFESSRELALDFAILTQTPSFCDFTLSPGSSVGQYRVCYEEAEIAAVFYFDTKATISAPWEAVRHGETLLYASLPFIELQLQQRGFVTVHAAAVATSKGAVVILGKEDAGKTATALSLCLTHRGRLIGNDLVILGSKSPDGPVIAIGGTTFLSLRYESIRRSMPHLLRLFPPREGDTWLRKVIVDPLDASVSVQGPQVTELGKVFIVHVDDTKADLFIEPADTVVTRLYLNENFSRYIRATSIALLGENREYLGYVPSLDSTVLFEMRRRLISRLVTDYSMEYVSGPLWKITEYVGS
jgi:hypothetical protein